MDVVQSGKLFKWALMDETLTVCGKSLFCTAYNRHITAGGFKTYQPFEGLF